MQNTASLTVVLARFNLRARRAILATTIGATVLSSGCASGSPGNSAMSPKPRLVTADQLEGDMAAKTKRDAALPGLPPVIDTAEATSMVYPGMPDLPEPTLPPNSMASLGGNQDKPVAVPAKPEATVVLTTPKTSPVPSKEVVKVPATSPVVIARRDSVVIAVPATTPRMPVAIRRDSIITLTTVKRGDGRAEPVTRVSYKDVPEPVEGGSAAATTNMPTTRNASNVTSVREPAWIQAGDAPSRVNVSFYRDELADVLTLFAKVGNVSIITSDEADVTGKLVTAEISDKPWNTALETLLRAVGLRAIQDDVTGIITVQSERRSSGLRQPEIIRLRYVDADDILPILQAIIGSGITSGGGGGGQSQGQNQTGGGAGGGAAGMVTSNTEGDVITAVKTGAAKSRTLMVYTSPDKLAKVREMVAKVDRKRPTVAIQVRMVFINRSKINRYGFNYNIVPKNGGTDNASAAVTQNGAGDNLQAGSSSSAFSMLSRFALNRNTNLSVFFDALSSVGLAEVEAAPIIVTTSDLQANIQVGEFFILPNPSNIVAGANVVVPGQGGGQQGGVGGQQGGIGGQQGGVGGQQGGVGGQQGGIGGQQGGLGGQQGSVGAGIGAGQSSFSNFQTGTTLQVTPYALPNGRIRMALQIQRSQGNLNPGNGTITGPQQQAQTEVIVDDNEMIVIGGLTVVQKTIQKGGIPILSELPLIGALFKSQNIENQLFQDLVIVVQPKLIDADDEDTDMVNFQPASPPLPVARPRQ